MALIKRVRWTCGICGYVNDERYEVYAEAFCTDCGEPTTWDDMQRWCEHGVPVWHRRCPECDRYEYGDMQREEERLFG